MAKSKKQKEKINNKIGRILKNKKLEKTEKFFHEYDNYEEKYSWLKKYKCIFSSKDHPTLKELKQLRSEILSFRGQSKLNTITNIRISGFPDLRLQPDSDKIMFFFEGINDTNISELDYKIQIEKCLAHIDALIESYWLRNEIIELIDGKGSGKSRPIKTDKIRDFSKSFIQDLSDGKFITNEDITKGLKKIESKYKPIGEKQRELLNTDGSPIEKRICLELAKIYQIKFNDPVHWTTVRDAFRSINMSISKMG